MEIILPVTLALYGFLLSSIFKYFISPAELNNLNVTVFTILNTVPLSTFSLISVIGYKKINVKNKTGNFRQN